MGADPGVNETRHTYKFRFYDAAGHEMGFRYAQATDPNLVINPALPFVAMREKGDDKGPMYKALHTIHTVRVEEIA